MPLAPSPPQVPLPLVSLWYVSEGYLDTNSVYQSQCPALVLSDTPHVPHPQLTPEEGSVPSWVALGQGHLVLHLAQDGVEDAAESPGTILSREARSEVGLGYPETPPLQAPNRPGTLFSKLYLLRSRDSVARRSPCVRAPCQGWGAVTPFSTPLLRELPQQPP